jgi:hypothetical protein
MAMSSQSGGELDGPEAERDGRPGVEFSWEGNDKCDRASGRGWAVLEEDGSLRGRIFFHLGRVPVNAMVVATGAGLPAVRPVSGLYDALLRRGVPQQGQRQLSPETTGGVAGQFVDEHADVPSRKVQV